MLTYEQWKKELIIVRGGGDIATGTIYKLFQCGFPILVLEVRNPSCIRRSISFCEAIPLNEFQVEDVTAVKIEDEKEAYEAYQSGKVPVCIDEDGVMIERLAPFAVVDAILAKKNLGTRRDMAPIVIGLGPGFCAGKDVDAVIETKRGHRLGRVIYDGEAAPNSGVPGMIAGYSKERVLHAPCDGELHIVCDLGEIVEQGQTIAMIGEVPLPATITGLVRGMIRDGYQVQKGLKIADIDPRKEEKKNYLSISDKARCVAGGCLEAIMHLRQKTEINRL